MAERYSSFRSGSASWFLQRVTAAFLVVALASHFFVVHFVNHPYEITLAGTRARMRNVGYFASMALFLVLATFHGVNGVYNSLVARGLSGTPKRVVLAILAVSGLALVAQGLYVAVVMAGWA
jgi:succinate dehydrogenase / fumarate reductase membrane anchor subunit